MGSKKILKVLVTQSYLTLCNPMDDSPSRLLCPWNSPGKGTGVGSHCLLQGIFPTHGSNPSLLHCWQILYHLSHQGNPTMNLFTEKKWRQRCREWSGGHNKGGRG